MTSPAFKDFLHPFLPLRSYCIVMTEFYFVHCYSSYFDIWANFLACNKSLFHRYGPLWITTTLIFMLAAFGNFATYLMQRKTDLNIWNFDVGYFNWAASVMYGYAIVVPAAFFFLFQYFGSRPSLVRFWCMWGYSLFIFIPASVSILVLSHYPYTFLCCH